jgi:hypothetical protein
VNEVHDHGPDDVLAERFAKNRPRLNGADSAAVRRDDPHDV